MADLDAMSRRRYSRGVLSGGGDYGDEVVQAVVSGDRPQQAMPLDRLDTALRCARVAYLTVLDFELRGVPAGRAACRDPRDRHAENYFTVKEPELAQAL